MRIYWAKGVLLGRPGMMGIELRDLGVSECSHYCAMMEMGERQ